MASFTPNFLSLLLLLACVQAASSSTSQGQGGNIARNVVKSADSSLRPTWTRVGTGGAFPIGPNTTWTSTTLHPMSTSLFITTTSSTSNHYNGTKTSTPQSFITDNGTTTRISSTSPINNNGTASSNTSGRDTSVSSSSSHSPRTDSATAVSSVTSNSTSHSTSGSTGTSAGLMTFGSATSSSTSQTKSVSTFKSGPTMTTGKPTSDSSSNTGTSSKISSPLTHFTIFPSHASISTISGNPTQSHVDVTSSGKVIHVPVLHNCWFCPPGGGFFALFGFIAPGIYPAGGPPDGFPTPFPEITVGPDGDPTFSNKPTNSPSVSRSNTITSKPTSTASDICTTATVSDCSTSLSYGVSDGKTTTTATITSCKPRVGCSVTGTSFTTATTASTNGTCWRYSYGNDADNDDGVPGEDDLNDDTGVIARRRQRGIAGRRAVAKLQVPRIDPKARAALIRRNSPAPVKELKYTTGTAAGDATSCGLIIPSATGTGAAPASVTIPSFPGVDDLEAHNPKGAVYWYVPTTSASPNGCPTVTMTTYPNSAALVAAPVIHDLSGNGQIYQVGGNPPRGKPGVNVDHVYELKFLQDFFQDALGSGQINCKDFNDFFMAYDSAAGENVPRYQVLWDQVPSDSNPDFAGVDNWINKLKGFLFNSGLAGLRDPTKPQKKQNPWTDDDKIQLVNQIVAAIDFTNRKEVADLFKKTNTRIYEAFRGIDNLIASLKGCGQMPPEPQKSPGKGWADVYSDYMENLIKTQNSAIETHLSLMTASAFFTSPADPSVTGGVKAFTEAYPPSRWTFDADALLEWPTTSALAIAKRDGAVCSLSKRPSSSPTASRAGSPTPSGSEGGNTPPASTRPSLSPTKTSSTPSPPPSPSTSTTAAPPSPPPTTTTSSSTQPPPPPATPPPAKDTCGDWYRVLFDHFEIYGKNFDASKFGDDGAGLKKQIQGCGKLTRFSFKQLTNDPNGYQWYASGNLPIGTKACVGRAVVSAGGASPDGCHGAG